MKNDLISEEELTEIKKGMRRIYYLEMLKGKNIEYLKPFITKLGYMISYSLDVMPGITSIYHVSIGQKRKIIDPAEANVIVCGILPAGYIDYGSQNDNGILHFYWCEDMLQLERMLEGLRKYRIKN